MVIPPKRVCCTEENGEEKEGGRGGEGEGLLGGMARARRLVSNNSTAQTAYVCL